MHIRIKLRNFLIRIPILRQTNRYVEFVFRTSLFCVSPKFTVKDLFLADARQFGVLPLLFITSPFHDTKRKV